MVAPRTAHSSSSPLCPPIRYLVTRACTPRAQLHGRHGGIKPHRVWQFEDMQPLPPPTPADTIPPPATSFRRHCCYPLTPVPHRRPSAHRGLYLSPGCRRLPDRERLGALRQEPGPARQAAVGPGEKAGTGSDKIRLQLPVHLLFITHMLGKSRLSATVLVSVYCANARSPPLQGLY